MLTIRSTGMGKLRDCPRCQHTFEYPDGPEKCPNCGFKILDWWESRQKGLACRFNLDRDDIAE